MHKNSLIDIRILEILREQSSPKHRLTQKEIEQLLECIRDKRGAGENDGEVWEIKKIMD